MRILLISNMLPSEKHPVFGVFVARRIASYRSLGADVTVVANQEAAKSRAQLVAKYAMLVIRAVVGALRSKPDIIEAHYLYPTALIAALSGLVARRPIVLVAHGSDVALEHGTATKRLLRWAVGRAERVIANSPATAEMVRGRYPESVVEIIPPGVVLDELPAIRHTREPIVGFVGTLADHKAPDLVVEALALMEDDVTAVIVGSGPEEAALRRLVARLGLETRVRFAGQVLPGDLAGHYRSFAVLAVPSRREGFGLVAVEALAHGTPVVVTDIGGLPTIPTAECGTVVAADDRQALADALANWIARRSDPDLAVVCRARAGHFAESAMARMSLDVLESVVR